MFEALIGSLGELIVILVIDQLAQEAHSVGFHQNLLIGPRVLNELVQEYASCLLGIVDTILELLDQSLNSTLLPSNLLGY